MAETGFILKIENPYPVFREDLVPISSGQVMRIGRGEGNEVIILNQFISRHHFTLIWTENKLVLQDQKSLNGTKINGKRVKEQQELKLGDRIEISNVKITVMPLVEGQVAAAVPTLAGARPSESMSLDSDRKISSSVTLVNEAPPKDAHFGSERRRKKTVWEGDPQEQAALAMALQHRTHFSLVLPLALGLVLSLVLFLFF